MSSAGIGLLVVVGLLCIALSIFIDIALVFELKSQDKTLYESLGQPRLIRYDWTALPRNKAYSAWLRDVAADPTSRYSGRARLIKVLRTVFYVCWFAALLVALASSTV
jgi:hypothetical protein